VRAEAFSFIRSYLSADMSRRLLLSLLAAGWIAFIAIGAWRAETNIEDFFPWLPDDAPNRNAYVEFLERFGTDDVLIVSWEGCALDDSRVSRLAEALEQRESEWVQRVITAPRLIEELTRPPTSLSIDEAKSRLTNILIGPDGRTTALLVQLTRAGMEDRRKSVRGVMDLAGEVIGLPSEELKLGGHPYVGYYSAEQTQNSIVWLSIPVALISTVMAWVCMRKLRLVVLTLVTSGLTAGTALALIPWTGQRVNGLLAALPSLVFVLTTSGVIHVVNYSLGLRRLDKLRGKVAPVAEHTAAVRRKAWKPCLLSAVSSTLGTISLCWSDFPAIRDFGTYATIGILLTFVMHLVILPEVLGRLFQSEALSLEPDPLLIPFGILLRWILAHHRLVIGVVLTTTAMLIIPLFRLQARFTLDRMYPADSAFSRNTVWLEEHVGPIDATEVLIDFEADGPRGFFARLNKITRLEEKLSQLPAVSTTFSTATFIPPLRERPTWLTQGLRRSAIEQARAKLLGGTHLVSTGDVEHWRITLRTPLFGGVPRDELARQVRELLAEETQDWPGLVAADCTGSSQLFFETQRDVLMGFARNLVLTFAMVFVMMTLALRNIAAGLLAMLPNLVPSIAVFGTLGWLDGSVDIGMTVAGCTAVGIAVDNTAHLLMSYRDALLGTNKRERALAQAYAHSAIADFQTSLMCGLSMLPYIASEQIYLSRFGLVMSVLLCAAMIGDVVLLPALIASRVGRVFDLGVKRRGKGESRAPKT
jgi:predicted RND superfamily exporter protein